MKRWIDTVGRAFAREPKATFSADRFEASRAWLNELLSDEIIEQLMPYCALDLSSPCLVTADKTRSLRVRGGRVDMRTFAPVLDRLRAWDDDAIAERRHALQKDGLVIAAQVQSASGVLIALHLR